MPPKSKKAKRGNEKKMIKVSLDDIDTTELTKEKLIEFCVRVNEELNSERQHSDFLRLDRDKLAKMVDIANKQMVALKTENRQREIELGECEEAHRKEMADNRQKIIHLMTEKNIDGLNRKIEADKMRNEENMKHKERMGHLRNDIKQMKEELIKMEDEMKEEKLKLQIKHAEMNSTLREEDKKEASLKESMREKCLFNKTQELTGKFAKEYNGLEKRKNKQINYMLKYNEKFNSDIKHYYNNILLHNMKVLSELKESLKEMKTDTAKIDMELTGLRNQNEELSDELKKLLANERSLQSELTSSKRDKNELKYTKKALESGNCTFDHMRWELYTLRICKDKQDEWLEEERDRRKEYDFSKMERVVESLLAWEYIVIHLHYKHKETDSTLRKMRQLYHKKDLNWPSELDELFDPREYTTLDEGYYQVAAALDRRDRMIGAVREILRKRGMNEDDLGFTPQTEDDILSIEPLRLILQQDDVD